MTRWMRYTHAGRAGFGIVAGDALRVHAGRMYEDPMPTGDTVALADVTTLAPSTPGQIVALWNNFHELAETLGIPVPEEPLYFIKGNNALLAHGQRIRKPSSYDGEVVFEGELGIVIGRRCRTVTVADAPAHIFGYTCVNDVTAVGLIDRDPSFQQWTRAKSFDTFAAIGPVVATGLDPATLRVRTELDGSERQNYPVTDMVFAPAEIVSRISQDMTLAPGDVICCGTSVGVGSMRPGSLVEVTIEGVGTLSNRYDA